MNAPLPSPRWQRLLAPRALVAGVVVAFLSCCLGGRWFSGQPLYRNFVRFHYHLSPQAPFYPTASQVKALGESQTGPDQILVVVGGSSVLYGSGQREQEVWTNKLQALLGEHYRVLNLAMPAAGAMEFGGVAAEMLRAHHPKLLFITAGTVWGGAGDACWNSYKYFFYDAVYHGLLPVDPEHQTWITHVKERHAAEKTWPEMHRQMEVDRVVCCRDLWTTIEYSRCGTIYRPGPLDSTRPRRCCSDPDPGSTVPVSARYPPARDAELVNWVRWELGYEAELQGARPPLVVNMEEALPPSTRPRTLAILFTRSPYYLNRLSADERQRYVTMYVRAQQALERAGIAALSLGMDWTAEDYYDFCHPGESGGAKLAEAVAPRLQEMAQRLGYLGEKAP
jgi:hypothetical protein